MNFNGKSQTNRDQKQNLSVLQRQTQYQIFRIKLVKKSTKDITQALIFTILDILQLKKLVIVKIFSVNSLYLLINQASGYIKEKSGNRYLIFDGSVHENKELLKKYAFVWDGLKNKIKAINGGKENDYGKDYMKIKFNSDDDKTTKISCNDHNYQICF